MPQYWRLRFLVSASFSAAICGCLSLSLGGKHEVVQPCGCCSDGRVEALQARVDALEQKLGTATPPALAPVTEP